MFYKSVVVECSTGTEDLAKAIEKKAEEMMKKGTYNWQPCRQSEQIKPF